MPHLDRDLFRRLCRARELLREEREEARSVRALAEAVTVSPFHFIRRFEQVFGATPGRYRTRMRIERARRLLARGESVTGTCLEVGFSSLGSFSRLFRAEVGASPSEYRRRMRALGRVPGRLAAELEPGCLCLMGRLPAGAFRNSREAGGRRVRACSHP